MLKRAMTLCAVILAVCLSVPVACGAVPKLLILEHFADYFG
jgi:hypothetical protein